MRVTKVKVNPNAIMLYITLASVLLSYYVGNFGGEGLHKAAFIVATGFATNFVSTALIYSAAFTPKKDMSLFTRVDINTHVSLLCAIVMMGFAVLFMDVGVFTDSAVEAVFGGLVGGASGVVNALAKKDTQDEE